MNNKKQELTLELISGLIDNKLLVLKRDFIAELDKRMEELASLRIWKDNVQSMLHNSALEEPDFRNKLFSLGSPILNKSRKIS